VGAMIGGLTYGVKKDEGYRHFEAALQRNPESAIARVEYARALRMLDGKRRLAEADTMLEQAAAVKAHDAVERLDIEAARIALKTQLKEEK
jgi:hypothetical protein